MENSKATETENREQYQALCSQEDNTALRQNMTRTITPKQSILSPKNIVKFGCWNVRTIYEPGKLAQVIKEMNEFHLEVLGISECRWTNSGAVVHNSRAKVYYSGRNDGKHYE